MSSESRSQKPWFQDCRTGCEKQAHYFVRIRKLQDELINREQHNLINAMERLRQISNPRRKTGLGEDSINLPRTSQSFPSRQLNLRKQAKHKAIPKHEKPDLKPVAGKPLIPEREKKTCGPSIHPFFTLPLLTDTDIAKIVHNASCSFPREPSTYLLQPHLPSIPNAGRKAHFVLDNRMRLLTLAGSDPEFSEGNVTGTTKKIHKDKNKKNEGEEDSGRKIKSSESKGRAKSQQVWRFDIDLNDPSIFTHSVDETEGIGEEMTTPLPPPNSRPSSTKLKVGQSNEDIGISCKDGNVVNPDKEISLTQESKEQSSEEKTAVVAAEESLEEVDLSITNAEQSTDIKEQTREDRVDEPVRNTEELAERSEQSPKTAVEQSVTNTGELTGRTEEPEETVEKPVTNTEELTEKTGQPQETIEQPVTTEDQPEEIVEQSRNEGENLAERKELVKPGREEVPGDSAVINPEEVEE